MTLKAKYCRLHLLNCQQFFGYTAGLYWFHENLLRPQGLALVKAGALELLQHLAEPMAEAGDMANLDVLGK